MQDKGNKLACAPSKDSDQSDIKVLGYYGDRLFMRASNNLITLGGCTGWSEFFNGAWFFHVLTRIEIQKIQPFSIKKRLFFSYAHYELAIYLIDKTLRAKK